MEKLKRCIAIYWIHFRCGISRELAFRFSFFAGLVGSFVFVVLNLLIIFFLMQKISIGRWTAKEMWILLASFLIIYYSFFFFFWRGLLKFVRNIRDGLFDYYLLKPFDLQYMMSMSGGGIHNLLAIFFGFAVLFWGLINYGASFNIFRMMISIFSMAIAAIDFYSLILFFVSLNFRFGYFEEVIGFVLSFQDFSRYPLDAFASLPLQLLIFAVPFSAMSTIPAITLINKTLPVKEILLFLTCSFAFIYFVRRFFYRAVRNYSSSG